MSDIKDWDVSAGGNDATPPAGAPEGWAPPEINGVVREIMASVRRWYDDPEWLYLVEEYAVTKDSGFTVRIAGVDVTAKFPAGCLTRMEGGGNLEAVVESVAMDASDTVVTYPLEIVVPVGTNNLARWIGSKAGSSAFAGVGTIRSPGGGGVHTNGVETVTVDGVSTEFLTDLAVGDRIHLEIAGAGGGPIEYTRTVASISTDILMDVDVPLNIPFAQIRLWRIEVDGDAAKMQELGDAAYKDMGAGSTLDADTVDGLHASELVSRIFDGLVNGTFRVWQRGTAPTACIAGSRTFLADRWYIEPAGANVNQEQNAALPTDSKARYSLKVTGATSVTTVKIGQRIESDHIPALKGTVTFAALVFNGTGADFTPTLLLGTPTADNNFAVVNNRLSTVLGNCPSGVWTQVSLSPDISGYTDVDNGLEVELQIPGGSLDSGGKNVSVTEIQLASIDSVPPITVRPITEELALCERYYAKTFPIGTAPAQAAGSAGSLRLKSTNNNSEDEQLVWTFAVRQVQAAGTVVTYNPVSANALTYNETDTLDVNPGTSIVDVSDRRVVLKVDIASADQNDVLVVHATADAEL